MNKVQATEQAELNARLGRALLKNLEEYMSRMPASLAFNAHMHSLPVSVGWIPAQSLTDGLTSFLKNFISNFESSYVGNNIVGSVVTALCAQAKHYRAVRPNEPDRHCTDAVLVDFLNFFASKRGCDLGFYTKDLYPQPNQAKESVMRKIELWTEDHTARNPAAVSEYVATVEIAPFPDKGMPTFVGWGDRIFHLNPAQVQFTNGSPWKYQECFAVVSFTASPGLPRAGG